MSRILSRTRHLVLIPVIGLVIAVMGVFLGLRAWSTKLNKEFPSTENEQNTSNETAHPREATDE